MFTTYFKTSVRFLLKNRFYALINIFGLALGIATFLLIALWVIEEVSYDRFHTKAEHIFRMNVQFNETETPYPSVALPLAETLEDNFPEIQKIVRIRPDQKPLITKDQIQFYEKSLLFVDPAFFEIFDFELLKGNKTTALDDPHAVVITEAMATKYFGEEDPIGQVLIYQNKTQLKVTGIIQNPPTNSHIQFDFIAPFSLYEILIREGMNKWFAGAFTYLFLQKETDISAFNQKLTAFARQAYQPHYPKADKYQFPLTPLSKVHLWSEDHYDLSPPGSIWYVYLLGAIALLVLIIACINYINMATAQGAKRAMEVGLRKTVGASGYQLFSQFMVEAFCLVSLSLLISLAITRTFLPYFNNLTDKSLTLPLTNPLFWIFVVCITALVSFLSGSYPAIFLSRFLPLSIFNKTHTSRSGYDIRRGLVVFQFFISYALIIATMILKSQMHYLQTVNLGFDKENTIVLPVNGHIKNNFAAFKNTLLNQPEVLEVGAASSLPGNENLWITFMEEVEGIPEAEKIPVLFAFKLDTEILSLLNLELVAGRLFSDSIQSDFTESVIINETAAQQLGWYANDSLTALGKYIKHDENEPKQYVIGVVKDFHFQTLKSEIQPTIFWLISPEETEEHAQAVSFVPVKISGHDIPSTLKNLEKIWQQFIPDIPFEYSFLDEDFERFYRKEEKMAATFTSFSIIAIGLSFLGIIGLTTFVALQRTKEIGIRKVLGASVSNILLLLSKDYIKLILIAFIIAIPVANYFITEWLQEFAYRIEVQWWMFAVPGLLVLLIALFSVMGQTWKAARANPVESLRDE